MKSKGFTLFEVLISVSIFIIISGALFMTVTTGVRTSNTLAQRRLQSERLDTLFNFFRQFFANLPPSAEITFEVSSINSNLKQPFLFLRNAPSLFFGSGGNHAEHAIGVLPGSNGVGTLALKSYPDTLSENEHQEILSAKADWISLLAGVSKVRWRFLDDSSTKLREEWNFGRPRLVEMTLWLAGEYPVIGEFWIPPVQKTPPTSILP